jgi:hypothetical protein
MYVVVWHRNHLGMLSAEHLVNNGNGVYSYDFSADSSQVYGGALNTIELMPEVWGLPSGDVNCDGEIDLTDKVIWESAAGKPGYLSTDLNLDGQVDNADKLDFWLKNEPLNCHVPD